MCDRYYILGDIRVFILKNVHIVQINKMVKSHFYIHNTFLLILSNHKFRNSFEEIK